ncbi:MAG: membrane dipeptidase [Chthoniobacterales bacterium]
MRPIIDSHLDLSWNALSWNRDITKTIGGIRGQEMGMNDTQGRGIATVCLPEMKRAHIRICFATLLARAKNDMQTWKRTDLDFRNQEIAGATARGQLEYYHILERQGLMRQLFTASDVKKHWDACEKDFNAQPLGYVLAMEGADPILNADDLAVWWERGLRLLGLSHYGQSAYSVGTNDSGPLTPRAPEFLKAMEKVGMILDVTHLCDQSFFQAVDLFGGRIHASHNNCRSLVANERQFTDEQLRIVIERKGVIGAVLDTWMLYPAWVLGQTSTSVVTMENVADHIDHVCQLAGNTEHAAIGSDLDGGYGKEQSPGDMDTIYDLHKLEGVLERRGYKAEDIDRIFYKNWYNFLLGALPA